MRRSASTRIRSSSRWISLDFGPHPLFGLGRVVAAGRRRRRRAARRPRAAAGPPAGRQAAHGGGWAANCAGLADLSTALEQLALVRGACGGQLALGFRGLLASLFRGAPGRRRAGRLVTALGAFAHPFFFAGLGLFLAPFAVLGPSRALLVAGELALVLRASARRAARRAHRRLGAPGAAAAPRPRGGGGGAAASAVGAARQCCAAWAAGGCGRRRGGAGAGRRRRAAPSSPGGSSCASPSAASAASASGPSAAWRLRRLDHRALAAFFLAAPLADADREEKDEERHDQGRRDVLDVVADEVTGGKENR